jgi:hypothetical protein
MITLHMSINSFWSLFRYTQTIIQHVVLAPVSKQLIAVEQKFGFSHFFPELLDHVGRILMN